MCLHEKNLTLTPIEFDILWLLCENRGKVISSEELFEIGARDYFYGQGVCVIEWADLIAEEIPPGSRLIRIPTEKKTDSAFTI